MNGSDPAIRPRRLTVVICTHNRAALLERTLASLNAAVRPGMPVQIFVAANACSDDTVARLRTYQARQQEMGWLPLRLIEVPRPGKANALNQALPLIETELTAFVDDDHRVDRNYFVAIEEAAHAWPDADLYCGRILPDWEGTEPAWVHDTGRYRIYPLPVPRYDQGDVPKKITAEEGPIPGGGNLVVRLAVFRATGQFSTALGPHGHDLMGGEDSEYVLRAMQRGFRCQYVPGIIQYHYVDPERLRLGYLLRKSYQRTRSVARIHGDGTIPLYMWRKLAEYGLHSVFSLSWSRRRFYLVRLAAIMGEIRGRREGGHRRATPSLRFDRDTAVLSILALCAGCCGLVAFVASGEAKWAGLLPPAAVAALGTLALMAKSLASFSQTGPQIRDEVVSHYRRYSLVALMRLGAWAFAVMFFAGGVGVLLYFMAATALETRWSAWIAALAAVFGIAGASALQFVRMLRFNPGLLVASMHYRMSRLYPLWEKMTPSRIGAVRAFCAGTCVLLLMAATWKLGEDARWQDLTALWAAVLFVASLMAWAVWEPEGRPPRRTSRVKNGALPNIVMIGSDTLRADRLGAMGYRRALTPHIDTLASRGTLLANCYVPCARTAPSLISLLTGTWPHTHGVRDNFVSDEETRLTVDSLPQLLKAQGYRTAAISDWCGADMGKFNFGFEHTDLPDDQWNIKYLIRQGPKDLRLFLSLFLHNRLGRLMLPEVYYLGGVPLTRTLGRRARRLLSRLAAGGEPFFLNVFYSTTHPPFASEWPYYIRCADPNYRGASKFAMARLTDPFDILRRQGAPREEFDLDQIIDLYDGCVAAFDDEVGSMLAHLEACGLADNTIVVVYSDHGMEFFEHETWGQGNSAVGEASPRIPLVIHDPRRPGKGRVDAVTRSVDLAPTLLALVGAPPPRSMDGVSLAECLRTNAPWPELDAFNETGIWITDVPGLPSDHLRYPNLLELLDVPNRETGTLAIKRQYRSLVIRAKDRMVRHGQWKLVYQPLSEGYLLRLFDLAADPACQRDVAADQPAITAALWARLAAWMTQDPESGLAPGKTGTTGSASFLVHP